MPHRSALGHRVDPEFRESPSEIRDVEQGNARELRAAKAKIEDARCAMPEFMTLVPLVADDVQLGNILDRRDRPSSSREQKAEREALGRP